MPAARPSLVPLWLAIFASASTLWSVQHATADEAATHAAAAVPAGSSPIDFERHVAPLLGRHGCNSAACHGAFGGKGGMQLSLFGYSPQLDFRSLEQRLDAMAPSESMILRKPGGQEEHGGGIRFEADSHAYRTIRNWIKAGAPWKQNSGDVKRLIVSPPLLSLAASPAIARPRSLTVTAQFSDGSQDDVTKYCQFSSRDEGIASVDASGRITAQRVGDTSIIVSYCNTFSSASVFVPNPESGDARDHVFESSSPIDRRVRSKLDQLNIVPSPPSNDQEFLRRVFIDVIGMIPTPEEVLAFSESQDPNKREKIIDTLLIHPMHAALWATRMGDITKCDVGSMGDAEPLGQRRAQMWHDWFRKRFAANASYADIARGVITATSREGKEAGLWVTAEAAAIRRSRESFDSRYAERDTLDLYWRRVSEDGRFPIKEMAELTTVAFTGVRIGCAQCHKHPFDRWTQNDYAAMGNIFSRVVYGSSTEVNVAILDELDRRRAANRAGTKLPSLPRIREVFTSDELGRRLSGSENGVNVAPRAFDSGEFDSQSDLRQQFYDWLIEPENPYFAPSFVNRVWAVYFGVGIVNPVDDFSATNLPSHPKLLDDLARSFRESQFDIRELEKQILLSASYQRSSTPNDSNRMDRRNFARQNVRPLLAEVALDVINAALGVKEDFSGDAPTDALAIEVGTNRLSGDAGRTLDIFGRGRRETNCDCDRRTEADLRQFLFLVNDESIHKKIKQGSIQNLRSLENRPLVEQLYLRMLGRLPNEVEIQIGRQHFDDAKDRQTAFDDLVWALINTREFITNH